MCLSRAFLFCTPRISFLPSVLPPHRHPCVSTPSLGVHSAPPSSSSSAAGVPLSAAVVPGPLFSLPCLRAGALRSIRLCGRAARSLVARILVPFFCLFARFPVRCAVLSTGSNWVYCLATNDNNNNSGHYLTIRHCLGHLHELIISSAALVSLLLRAVTVSRCLLLLGRWWRRHPSRPLVPAARQAVCRCPVAADLPVSRLYTAAAAAAQSVQAAGDLPLRAQSCTSLRHPTACRCPRRRPTRRPCTPQPWPWPWGGALTRTPTQGHPLPWPWPARQRPVV
jgi:hypothetical protein